MSEPQILSMWTVYDHPSDYPDKFVARRFEVDQDGPRATQSIIIADSIDKLRVVLQLEMNLVKIARNPLDDANIVETWL